MKHGAGDMGASGRDDLAVEQAFTYEERQTTEGILEMNRAAEEAEKSMAADYGRRGWLKSGAYIKGVQKTETEHSAALGLKLIQTRKDLIRQVPESAEDDRFTALKETLKRLVQHRMRSIPKRYSPKFDFDATVVGAANARADQLANQLAHTVESKVETMRLALRFRRNLTQSQVAVLAGLFTPVRFAAAAKNSMTFQSPGLLQLFQ
jgi:hypothetical protein